MLPRYDPWRHPRTDMSSGHFRRGGIKSPSNSIPHRESNGERIMLRNDCRITEPTGILGKRGPLGDDSVASAHQPFDQLVAKHLLKGRRDKRPAAVENGEELAGRNAPVQDKTGTERFP